MGSLILRLISEKGAAGFSFRFVSPTSAAAGIFSSARFSKFCRSYKLSARVMSTMSSVYNSDESSSTLPPSRISSPWLMLPPAFEGRNDMVCNFYSLAQNKVVSINKRGGEDKSEELIKELPDDDTRLKGSSHGWLALFNGQNCDLFLSNPLSGRRIKLPPIHTLPIPQVNLRGGFGCVKKVIISSSPDHDCRAMMAYGPELRLAFCCPGHSTEWTPIGEFFHEDQPRKVARAYEDFVYSSKEKLFFCITRWGDFEGWDLCNPQSPRIVWFREEDELELDEENYPNSAEEEELELEELCRPVKYLVVSEQSNQLFLVTRRIMERIGPDGSYVKSISFSYPYKTIGFDVHKIDWKGGKMKYMEGSLDGLVMFIGINHSFAMSADKFPELKPNSIYFTDAEELTPPKWIDSNYGGHDVGIFDYESRTFSSCYYPCDVQSIKRIMPAPLWFTPSKH